MRRWEGPDGLEIGAGESRVRAFEGVLSIVGALKTDAGNYTCVVQNAAGLRRRPVAIVVSGQFRVTPTFSVDSHLLLCSAAGYLHLLRLCLSQWRIQESLVGYHPSLPPFPIIYTPSPSPLSRSPLSSYLPGGQYPYPLDPAIRSLWSAEGCPSGSRLPGCQANFGALF